MAVQVKLFKVRRKEKGTLCSICRGYQRLCGKAICPILVKAEVLIKMERELSKKKVFGSSPPAVFVGSWNYPKILVGPLVPPISVTNPQILDRPEQWIDKQFSEILRYRFSLVRGKWLTNIESAGNPNKILSTFQELVMASKPTDTEMWFSKKPKLSVVFSPREAPLGPSASIIRTVITENPHVPKSVEYVTSDIDLKAQQGILRLHDSKVNQGQITRMLSIGLLGVKNQRRLVPSEWSITAIDDILGKAIREKIRRYPWINKFMIFGYNALANNVQILLFPSSWVFEAQEAWLVSPNPTPEIDFELVQGRRSYAKNIAGAYYATRLPVLEYLEQTRRQAGALVLMEVYPEWIPLGVWRFREICRHALKKPPMMFNTLEESLEALKSRMKLPLRKWLMKTKIIKWFKTQARLTKFFSG